MPARETRNSGRSPRAARPAASRPTSGSTVSSRSAAARRADASTPASQEHQRVGRLGRAAARGAQTERERIGAVAQHARAGAAVHQELGRGARARQRLVERGRGREPLLDGRRRRMGDHVVQPGRDARGHAPGPEPQRVRRRRQVRRWAVGQLAGERVVEGEPQGVDVGPGVAPAAGEHLRRRVRQRAGERAAAGDAELPVELGRAEVGEPRAAVGIEQDVLRLHVPVEDAAPVGGRERAGDIAPEPHGRIRVEPAALAHPHLQVGARGRTP